MAGTFVFTNGLQNVLRWRGLACLKINSLRAQWASPPSRCLACVTHEAWQGAEYSRALSRGSKARVVSGEVSLLKAGSLFVITALAGPGAKPAKGILALATDLGTTPPTIGEAITDNRCQRKL